MISEPVTEHCRVCEQPLKLERTPGDYVKGDNAGYIEAHAAYWMMCSGSGKRSKEFRDRNLAKKSARVIELVDQVKLDAEIAYDALQEDRAGFKYDVLLDIALREYQRRYPSPRKYKPYSTAMVRGGKYSTYKIDIYCTFCRGILVGAVHHASNPESIAKVNQHTMGCALLCLAGRREMISPEVRGLIDEDRASPDL